MILNFYDNWIKRLYSGIFGGRNRENRLRKQIRDRAPGAEEVPADGAHVLLDHVRVLPDEGAEGYHGHGDHGLVGSVGPEALPGAARHNPVLAGHQLLHGEVHGAHDPEVLAVLLLLLLLPVRPGDSAVQVLLRALRLLGHRPEQRRGEQELRVRVHGPHPLLVPVLHLLAELRGHRAVQRHRAVLPVPRLRELLVPLPAVQEVRARPLHLRERGAHQLGLHPVGRGVRHEGHALCAQDGRQLRAQRVVRVLLPAVVQPAAGAGPHPRQAPVRVHHREGLQAAEDDVQADAEAHLLVDAGAGALLLHHRLQLHHQHRGDRLQGLHQGVRHEDVAGLRVGAVQVPVHLPDRHGARGHHRVHVPAEEERGPARVDQGRARHPPVPPRGEHLRLQPHPHQPGCGRQRELHVADTHQPHTQELQQGEPAPLGGRVGLLHHLRGQGLQVRGLRHCQGDPLHEDRPRQQGQVQERVRRALRQAREVRGLYLCVGVRHPVQHLQLQGHRRHGAALRLGHLRLLVPRHRLPREEVQRLRQQERVHRRGQDDVRRGDRRQGRPERDEGLSLAKILFFKK